MEHPEISDLAPIFSKEDLNQVSSTEIFSSKSDFWESDPKKNTNFKSPKPHQNGQTNYL